MTDIRVSGEALLSTTAPVGIPFDPDDGPTLAREINALFQALRSTRANIVYTAEFAVRLHAERSLLGIKRVQTLAIGWPLMHCLDADEMRALIALALSGQPAGLEVSASPEGDARASLAVGDSVLARALSRMLAAGQIAREHWWPALWRADDLELPNVGQAWRRLRLAIERRGRAHWQSALDQALIEHPAALRLRALGGATLEGGSHRSAALAWLWEGLVDRVWTGLEPHFAPYWSAIADARQMAVAAQAVTQDAQRVRVRDLEARRRAGTLDADGLSELAHAVETMAGPRAAHALFREWYAKARSAEAALGLARTWIAIDPVRAQPALLRLARMDHPVAAQARQLLDQMPKPTDTDAAQFDLFGGAGSDR